MRNMEFFTLQQLVVMILMVKLHALMPTSIIFYIQVKYLCSNVKWFLKLSAIYFFSNGTTAHAETYPLVYSGFLITHIQTHGRTPVDELSARRRDL
jgi:hypothetical protein